MAEWTEEQLKEEQRKEAVIRMKLMDIFPETIRQFKEDGYVSRAEPPIGAFYWNEGTDLERIQQFEKAENALVYMTVRSYTNFGMMDTMFYVSKYPEEWKLDKADIRQGEAVCYVYNHDAPDLSEIGYISFRKNAAGSVTRTA